MMTALFAAQDALVAAIAAQSPDCRVSLGAPVPLPVPEEGIWVGVGGRVNADDYMTGACSRSESAELRVRMWAQKRGGTAKDARDRAAAFLEVVEDALASDRTLGGLCDFAAVTGIQAEDEAVEDKAVWYGIEATVTVDATVA